MTSIQTIAKARRIALATIGASLIGAMTVSAFGESRPPNTVNGAATQQRKEKDDFVTSVQKDLAVARSKLDQMKRDARHASGQARSDLKSAWRSLERQHSVVRGKLARLKSAAGDKWTSLKDGVQTELDKLKQSLRKRESTSS
jgi:hypothetical protein